MPCLYKSDALFSLVIIFMNVYSIRAKGKAVEQVEAEKLSGRKALEYLKVGGLDRVVAVRMNGILQDLSAVLDFNAELEPV